jgi:hypothetical protein
VLFCRTKRVRYSDIVSYSDVKEDVIELPRVFAESKDELLVTPSSPLISDALPFGQLRYGEPDAIDYAKHYSRSHDVVIRIYDEAGNVIETH